MGLPVSVWSRWCPCVFIYHCHVSSGSCRSWIVVPVVLYCFSPCFFSCVVFHIMVLLCVVCVHGRFVCIMCCGVGSECMICCIGYGIVSSVPYSGRIHSVHTFMRCSAWVIAFVAISWIWVFW